MNYPASACKANNISNIITELLGRKVASDKNLLECGLNSLMIIKLLAQIENKFRKEVTIKDFFLAPTIDGINHKLTKASEVARTDKQILSDVINLNYVQRSIWIHQKTNPYSFVYNIPCMIKINKPIQADKVNDIFSDLAKSYPELTSVIDEEPELHLNCNAGIDIPLITCEGGDLHSISFACNRFYREPFNLNSLPPIRGLLLTCKGAVHSVFIVLHHIVADGWSVKLISDFLSESLNGNVSLENTVPISNTKIPAPASSRDDLAWWGELLKSAPQTLDLPLDHTRPPTQTFNGALYNITLNNLDKKVRASCTRSHVTPYTWLLTVTSIFLSRYCHVDDMVIGTAVANRPKTFHQNSLGCFANVLPLLIECNSSDSFSGHLSKVQKVVKDALIHQSASFDQIVDVVNPNRNASHNPIFQVLYSYRSDSDTGNNNDNRNTDFDLALYNKLNLQSTSKFDLSFLVNETINGLSISIEYNTDLFRPETIASISSCFKFLLEQSIDKKSLMLKDFNMLTGQQDDWLNKRFTKSAFYSPTLESNPLDFLPKNDDIAIYNVTSDSVSNISYMELDLDVKKLSRNLEPHRGRLIGVLLPRTPEFVSIMMACLKAKVPYIPIEINQPVTRIKQIIEDSGINYVVVNKDFEISNEYDVDFVYLSTIRGTPLIPDPSQPKQDDVAYQIYTSGTTGKRKGVPIKRESLFNLLEAMTRTLDIHQIKSLSISSFSFDMSVPEIFLPLISKGYLVLVDTVLKQYPRQLSSIIECFEVNLMQATPSLWQLLVSSGWKGSKSLKAICGAEELSPDLVNNLLNKCDSVWNFYGPTEATVWCTAGRQVFNQSDLGESLPGYDLFLLDSNKKKVAIGAIGEIHIGGRGVTTGYINNYEENEKCFMHIPSLSDDCIYSTGDIGRIDGNGCLKYLGRNDFQIKVLGYRVDLIEIENAIREIKSVDEVCVVHIKELHMLSATVTPSKVDISSISSHLKARLPSYMIPGSYNTSDSLPKNINGKVDRKAMEKDIMNQSTAPPEDDAVLETLRKCWSNIFTGIDVKDTDDFFIIGGNSLLALSLLDICLKNGILVTLSDLFNNPVLSSLALNCKRV